MSHTPASTLLRMKLLEHDAVLMSITARSAQEYVGTVQKVYSRRFEGPIAYDAGPLHFVGPPGTFGNVILKNEERALVFLRYIKGSERYYQDAMHGHFSVIGCDERLLAIANWALLDERGEKWAPEYLRNAAFIVDSENPWQVALPYSLLEKHVNEELELLRGAKNA